MWSLTVLLLQVKSLMADLQQLKAQHASVRDVLSGWPSEFADMAAQAAKTISTQVNMQRPVRSARLC